jgi:hypothetical protein
VQPCRGLHGQHVGLACGAATGDVRDGQREQSRVVVARRRGQHERGGRPRRAAAQARSGRAQHEPADTIRSVPGELLGDGAAERVTEHVDALERQRVQQFFDDAGDARHPQRETGSLREAGAGRIERDQLAVAGESRERRPHVHMRADAGDEQ